MHGWHEANGAVFVSYRDSAVLVTATTAKTITTTTGYVSADYEQWVPGARMVLFALFFVMMMSSRYAVVGVVGCP